MRFGISALFLAAALLGPLAEQAFGQHQQMTTYLAGPVDLTGETATIQVRVNAPQGAMSVGGVVIYVPQYTPIWTVGPDSGYTIVADFHTMTLQVYSGVSGWTAGELVPIQAGGSASGWNYGFDAFRLTGYVFPNPAMTGNELQLNLTVKRAAPFAGRKDIALYANLMGYPVGGQSYGSAPGRFTPAGTWEYTPPGSPSSLTLNPTSASILAARHENTVSIQGATYGAATVTPGASWLRIVGPTFVGGSFTWQADPNLASGARPADITVRDMLGLQRVFTVSQAGLSNTIPTTGLDPPGASFGNVDTITVPVRVQSPNGANWIDNLSIYFAADLAQVATGYSLSVDFVARTLTARNGATGEIGPALPIIPGGSAANLTGQGIPGLEVTEWEFPNPNLSGPELRFNVKVRRSGGNTGFRYITLNAASPTAASSQPGPWVSAGTWGTPPIDFTLTAPSVINVGYNTTAAYSGTITPTAGVTQAFTVQVSANVAGASQATVNLNGSAQPFTINLPARTASYAMVVTATGSGVTRTQNVNVNVAPAPPPPSITLNLGQQSPASIFGGQAAYFPLTVSSTGYTGSVTITCSSAAGVTCPAQVVNVAPGGGSSPVQLPIVTTGSVLNGSLITVTATPTSSGAPSSQSENRNLVIQVGYAVAPPANSPITLFPNADNAVPVTVLASGGFNGTVSFGNCTGTALVIPCSGSVTVVNGQAAVASASVYPTATVPATGTLNITASSSGFSNQTVLVGFKQPLFLSIMEPLPTVSPNPATRIYKGQPVVFRWSTGIDPLVTSYRIRVSENVPNLVSPLHDAVIARPGDASLPASPPFTPSANYSGIIPWYVKVTGYAGTTAVAETEWFRYDVADPPVPPAITSPVPGTTLSGTTTFFWNPGTPGQYRLRVGTMGPGSSDVLLPIVTTGTNHGPVTIPAAVRVYVTLEHSTAGVFSTVLNYTYNGATQPGGGVFYSGTATVDPLGYQPQLAQSRTTTVPISIRSTAGFIGQVRLECVGLTGVSCPGTFVMISNTTASAPVSLPVVVASNAPLGSGLQLRIRAAAVDAGVATPTETFVPVTISSAATPSPADFRLLAPATISLLRNRTGPIDVPIEAVNLPPGNVEVRATANGVALAPQTIALGDFT